ncbi:hypothetical protein SDC9_201259 [bioreactor metagenome]|uniref:Uncharacterized protein n=1 Tax=bioreactor metagenome TaxID=1076179 RepID=A0A645IQF4_9ZZZZ
MIQPSSRLVGQKDPFLERAPPFVIGVVLQFGQRHMQLLGQMRNRFAKIQPLDVHHKLNDATARFAAKTVIYLLLPIHVERRRFFVVKRAQTDVSMPVLLKRHVGGYNLHNIRPRPQFIQPCRWKPSSH